MKRYHDVELELLYIIEQFALKCGVKDKYCTKAGKDLNEQYVALGSVKANVASMMMVAGWLKAESEGFLVPAEKVTAAKMKFDNAWRAAKELYEMEQKVSYLVMLKAAACGLRPPLGPWSVPVDGCDLRPEDPEMKKLLKEDPAEFLRRWKQTIGKAAGINPKYVRVDSDCLGGAPDPSKAEK